jgi:hypothetical protein
MKLENKMFLNTGVIWTLNVVLITQLDCTFFESDTSRINIEMRLQWKKTAFILKVCKVTSEFW